MNDTNYAVSASMHTLATDQVESPSSFCKCVETEIGNATPIVRPAYDGIAVSADFALPRANNHAVHEVTEYVK